MRLAALVAGALVLADVASAQPDANGRALQAVQLQAAFTPAPHAVSVRAGGNDRNPITGNGCAGYINNARPAVTLDYTAGAGRLFVYVHSNVDTTLLVHDANGTWHCSDDFRGSDPAVALNNPASGRYAIWVGTYTPGETGQQATVYLSERAPQW